MWKQARQAQIRQQLKQEQQRDARGRGGGDWSRPRGARGSHSTFRGSFRGRFGHTQGHRSDSQDFHHQRKRAKPWEDLELQSELALTETLRIKAIKAQTMADFASYRDQRSKSYRLRLNKMVAYFRENPEQENFWLPLLAMEASRESYFCDICEYSFKSLEELIDHEDTHEVCDLDGCQFNACPEVLQDHVLCLHATGLYARINKGYGTEEVRKWRDERKV